MRYRSTRGAASVTFSEAIEAGLAADGGLYVPRAWPRIDLDAAAAAPTLPELAARVLAPFVAGDRLADALPTICARTLSFPIPLVPLTANASLLELFWGPTSAFKDVGARFLAQCLRELGVGDSDRPRTILVATSGDTGGAVAAAFHRQPGIEVVVLFPRDGVSPRQRQQLTCWGDNVHSFAVRGTFDDCQRLLKTALGDVGWRTRRRLTTANSINLGRLLPQMVYYAAAALQHRRATGTPPAFVVPTGNVGNATAALWARRAGLPISRVVMACNDNRVVPEFLASGAWTPRPSKRTLANAMDVGDPSNMERVRDLFPDLDRLRAVLTAVGVDDAAIERTIRGGPSRYGRTWDPHTATAIHVLETERLHDAIVVATAHPAKFPEIVEPLIGHAVDIPPALAVLLARPSHCVEIDADLDALGRALDATSG